MDKEKVLSLAKLARIDISETEADKLSSEFAAILGYVGEVKAMVPAENSHSDENDLPLKNIMREDNAPHESGIYTKELLAQASQHGDYIKVKKIL